MLSGVMFLEVYIVGNKIKVKRATSSNVIGGDVSGGVGNKRAADDSDANSNVSQAAELVDIVEKKSGRLGLTLAIVFILLLIVLVVIS